MITLLVLANGRRPGIERTIASAKANLVGEIAHGVILDDSPDGDDDRRHRLRRFERCGFTVIRGPGCSGFGGALRAAWKWLLRHDAEPFIFHCGDDATFNRPMPLTALALTLASQPHLAQLALRHRAPDDAGPSGGGTVEEHPGAFTEIRDHAGNARLEHRLNFATGPCLYRRDLMTVAWPDGTEPEGSFGCKLKNQGLPWGVPGDDVRFAFWGARDSGPVVERIAAERVRAGR